MPTTQPLLFDRPLVRDKDPITSHIAADKVKDKVKGQAEQILAAIRKYADRETGITAKELSVKSGIDYYTIQRRLSMLVGRIEFLTLDGRWVFQLDENNRPATRDNCRIFRVSNATP